ncbi:helix-turn-helix domain-containing protein [Krasilnikovia sp. M28-CT-15]|uniref:helix-turn-helix domain-containing protein n=1 Tax=Krasilnikovia sp. M28-CT-15 TaxID=3373540 RepID=UPI003876350F
MGEASAAHGPYYRPAEVARLLRCSEWWIKEQARRRRIPFCWIGGSYLFTEEHIAAIVRLFEVRPTAEQEPTIVAVPESRRTPGSDDAPVARLRARPPRRVRDTTSRNTAA